MSSFFTIFSKVSRKNNISVFQILRRSAGVATRVRLVSIANKIPPPIAEILRNGQLGLGDRKAMLMNELSVANLQFGFATQGGSTYCAKKGSFNSILTFLLRERHACCGVDSISVLTCLNRRAKNCHLFDF